MAIYIYIYDLQKIVVENNCFVLLIPFLLQNENGKRKRERMERNSWQSKDKIELMNDQINKNNKHEMNANELRLLNNKQTNKQ